MEKLRKKLKGEKKEQQMFWYKEIRAQLNIHSLPNPTLHTLYLTVEIIHGECLLDKLIDLFVVISFHLLYNCHYMKIENKIYG